MSLVFFLKRIKLDSQLLLFTFVFLFVSNLSFGQLNVVADKTTATYELGEQMNFLVSGVNGSVNYTIVYDNFTTIIKSGTINIVGGQTVAIPFSSSIPGSVLCKVDYNNIVDVAGAAFSPHDIQAFESEPSDFDAYWNQQKALLTQVPIDPRLTLMYNSQYSSTYKINLANIDNRRVYGYITVPKEAGTYPALLTLPPYGATSNIAVAEDFVADAVGVISMSISIHNVEPNQVDPNSYIPDNTEDRSQMYYRYALLGCIRAIDYINSRSDFNGNLGVMGVSQGGGLAILTAGIDNRVKLLINSNPTMGHQLGLRYDRAGAFPYYLYYARQNGLNENLVANNLKYFDAIYFAKRYKRSFLYYYKL